MRTRRRLVFVFFLFLAFTVACSGKTEIKNAVTAYNRQLIEALSTAKAGRLEHFASPREVGRVDSYILYLKADGKLLISDLRELKFVRIEKHESEVKVWTDELWSYHYADFKTRKPLTEDELIRYKNLYTLVMLEGHWVVDGVEIKSETPLKDKRDD